MPRGRKPSGSGDAKRIASDIKAIHRTLVEQRNQMDGRIQAMEQAIAALTGETPSAAPRAAAAAPAQTGARRGRPPGSRSQGYRDGSLKAYIDKVLRTSGAPVAIKDITRGVTKAGYRTKSKTLGNQVSAAIADMKVRKVGRGMYTV